MVDWRLSIYLSIRSRVHMVYIVLLRKRFIFLSIFYHEQVLNFVKGFSTSIEIRKKYELN